jgi:hypothetical protein
MAKLYKPNGEIIEVPPKNNIDFSPQELIEFVDGYIEFIHTIDHRIMVVNKEGKNYGLPFNLNATKIANIDDVIVGNVLVCDIDQVR